MKVLKKHYNTKGIVYDLKEFELDNIRIEFRKDITHITTVTFSNDKFSFEMDLEEITNAIDDFAKFEYYEGNNEL